MRDGLTRFVSGPHLAVRESLSLLLSVGTRAPADWATAALDATMDDCAGEARRSKLSLGLALASTSTAARQGPASAAPSAAPSAPATPRAGPVAEGREGLPAGGLPAYEPPSVAEALLARRASQLTEVRGPPGDAVAEPARKPPAGGLGRFLGPGAELYVWSLGALAGGLGLMVAANLFWVLAANLGSFEDASGAEIAADPSPLLGPAVSSFVEAPPRPAGASLGALYWDEGAPGGARENLGNRIRMFGAGGAMALTVEDFLYVVQGMAVLGALVVAAVTYLLGLRSAKAYVNSTPRHAGITRVDQVSVLVTGLPRAGQAAHQDAEDVARWAEEACGGTVLECHLLNEDRELMEALEQRRGLSETLSRARAAALRGSGPGRDVKTLRDRVEALDERIERLRSRRDAGCAGALVTLDSPSSRDDLIAAHARAPEFKKAKLSVAPAEPPRSYLREGAGASNLGPALLAWATVLVLCVGAWVVCAELAYQHRTLEAAGKHSASLRALVRYASSSCVVVIGLALQWVLVVLARRTRHPTTSAQAGYLMTQLALSQWLLSFADAFAGMRIAWLDSASGGRWGTGPLEDFSPAWYQSVGAPLSLTLAGLALFPLLARAVLYSPRGAGAGLRQALSQAELNRAFLRPAFRLGLEWGNLLGVVLVALTYGAGYPFLYAVALLRVAAQVAWDRALLTRSVSALRPWGASVGLRAAGLLRFGLVAHACVAFWQLSFFETPPIEEKISGASSLFSVAADYSRSGRWAGTRYLQAGSFGMGLVVLLVLCTEAGLLVARAVTGQSPFVLLATLPLKRAERLPPSKRHPGQRRLQPKERVKHTREVRTLSSRTRRTPSQQKRNSVTRRRSSQFGPGGEEEPAPGGSFRAAPGPGPVGEAREADGSFDAVFEEPGSADLEWGEDLDRDPSRNPPPVEVGDGRPRRSARGSNPGGARGSNPGVARGSSLTRGAAADHFTDALRAGVVDGPGTYALTEEPLFAAMLWDTLSPHARATAEVDRALSSPSWGGYSGARSDPAVAQALRSRAAAVPVGLARSGSRRAGPTRSAAGEWDMDEVDEVLVAALVGGHLSDADLDAVAGMVDGRLDKGLGLDGVDLLSLLAAKWARGGGGGGQRRGAGPGAPARGSPSQRRLPAGLDPMSWLQATDLTPAGGVATLASSAQVVSSALEVARRYAPTIGQAVSSVAAGVYHWVTDAHGRAQPPPGAGHHPGYQAPGAAPPPAPAQYTGEGFSPTVGVRDSYGAPPSMGQDPYGGAVAPEGEWVQDDNGQWFAFDAEGGGWWDAEGGYWDKEGGFWSPDGGYYGPGGEYFGPEEVGASSATGQYR